MRTGRNYRESLTDGRSVYLDGRRLGSVHEDPTLARAIDLVADGYQHWFGDGEGTSNPLLSQRPGIPALEESMTLLRTADELLDITRAAVMCLHTAAGRLGPDLDEYAARIARFTAYVRDVDQRVVLCITDAKGDRSKSPANQDDPDAYVRVVERRADGVVIRGAKLHITGGPVAHELLVMPTKAMHDGEEDYAICCAIPVNSPGVHIMARTATRAGGDPRDLPFSSAGALPDGLVILDDVFVPSSRIFLDGEVAQAGTFAHALGLWVRLSNLDGLVTDAETLVGLAQLIAEANGLGKIAHVRHKIADMITYATLLRAGLVASLTHATLDPDGLAAPNELFANAAKFYGAENYALMVRHLHDICGALVATMPSMADLDIPTAGPLLRKYLSTGDSVPGDYRAALLLAIRDFTAEAAGNRRAIEHLHGGGGLFAQRIVTRGRFDMAAAKHLALTRAGLDPPM